jgi:hypothetical protein
MALRAHAKRVRGNGCEAALLAMLKNKSCEVENVNYAESMRETHNSPDGRCSSPINGLMAAVSPGGLSVEESEADENSFAGRLRSIINLKYATVAASRNNLEAANMPAEMEEEFGDSIMMMMGDDYEEEQLLSPDGLDVEDLTISGGFSEPEGFDTSYLLRRLQPSGPSEDPKQARNIGYGGESKEMSHEMKSKIALLNILQGHDLTLFSRILRWRWDSDHIYQSRTSKDESYYKTTKQKVLDNIGRSYGYQNLHPRIHKVILPKTKVSVDIVIFPFGDTLLSLLTDPVGMLPENLLIDLNDPFKSPKYGGEEGFLGDVNTGSVFSDNHGTHCKNPKLDIPAYIIGFLDKSHLDLKGKLTLEPFMYTLSIFNRAWRNKAEAWRPLGYVPNIDHAAPRAEAKDKLYDYHFCLRLIMSEMAAYQRLGGLDWKLPDLNGVAFPCKLQIPLLFIIGDTEGHDKLAGRKVDRSSGLSRQCRHCDVTQADCGNPYCTITLTKCADIRELREKAQEAGRRNDKGAVAKAEEELDDLSYRNIRSAFDDIIFVDQERGIHGATNAEVLHAINLGPQERAIDSCFKMKREMHVKKKRQGIRIREGSPPKEGSSSKTQEIIKGVNLVKKLNWWW